MIQFDWPLSCSRISGSNPLFGCQMEALASAALNCCQPNLCAKMLALAAFPCRRCRRPSLFACPLDGGRVMIHCCRPPSKRRNPFGPAWLANWPIARRRQQRHRKSNDGRLWRRPVFGRKRARRAACSALAGFIGVRLGAISSPNGGLTLSLAARKLQSRRSASASPAKQRQRSHQQHQQRRRQPRQPQQVSGGNLLSKLSAWNVAKPKFACWSNPIDCFGPAEWSVWRKGRTNNEPFVCSERHLFLAIARELQLKAVLPVALGADGGLFGVGACAAATVAAKARLRSRRQSVAHVFVWTAHLCQAERAAANGISRAQFWENRNTRSADSKPPASLHNSLT